MKIQAEDFWKFFQQNSDTLMDIDSLEEKQADELLEKTDKVLKQYSEGIDFELGDLTTKGRTLTFTAHGDTDYFDDLISLCENAPHIGLLGHNGIQARQGQQCGDKPRKIPFEDGGHVVQTHGKPSGYGTHRIADRLEKI